jgi:hypothetical protein
MKSAKKFCGQGIDVKFNLDKTIEEVKEEFKKLFIKRKELITRLGKAFESVVSNPEDVCEEIKNCLHEEIAQRIISARDIERYCPDKWKKKTKPKNDKLSFSKSSEQKPQQQIAATQEGKSVIVNEPSRNTNASSDDVNQLHEQSKQNGITIDKSASYNESSTIGDFPLSGPSYKQTGQECSRCLELQDKVIQLSEALQRISIPTADQIPPSEFEFTIPKEQYEMVKDAMHKSDRAIFVKCDEGKRFVRAVPDVDN